MFSYRSSELEKYMDSIEHELRKKLDKGPLGMDVIKELHEFYDSCFIQFSHELESVGKGHKRVA